MKQTAFLCGCGFAAAGRRTVRSRVVASCGTVAAAAGHIVFAVLWLAAVAWHIAASAACRVVATTPCRIAAVAGHIVAAPICRIASRGIAAACGADPAGSGNSSDSVTSGSTAPGSNNASTNNSSTSGSNSSGSNPANGSSNNIPVNKKNYKITN